MPWLSPDRFVDACGPLSAGLADAWRPRGGEEALTGVLSADPRRCVALVGDPGAGTSRLALELARRFEHAVYPDPVAPPDPIADARALEARLADVPANATPVAILDGPDRRASLAALPELLARPVHPRLKVLVPCDPRLARRLSRVGGGYPQGSILVATVGGEPAPVPPPPDHVEELLALLLAGRLPVDPRASREDRWPDRGFAVRHGDELVTLVPDRARAAWLEAALLDHDDGAARLRDVVSGCAAIRGRILETLLHVTDGEPPAALAAIACDLEADELPDPRALLARGIPLSPPVATTLLGRAGTLLDDGPPPEREWSVASTAAALHRMLGNREAEDAALDRAIATAPARAAARLKAERAGTRRDLDLAREAAEQARGLDDADTLAAALRQLVTLLHAYEDLPAALAVCEEWIEAEESSGRAAAAAAARARGARLAIEADEPDRALSMLREAASERRAVGDVRGLCGCLYRVAGLEADLRRLDEARETVREVIAIDERVDEPTGVGYGRWMLGAMAEKRGEAAEAAREYQASLDAYSRAGQVPDRLVASLVRARAHAEGSSSEVAPEDDEAVQMPDTPDGGGPEERLVELRVKPES